MANFKNSYEAWLIKTQRQILGINLKSRKAKQTASGSYLDLIPKMVIYLQESQNGTETESCLLPFYDPL